MSKRKKTVAILGGSGSAAVMVAFVSAYLFTSFGAVPVLTGSQLLPWDTSYYTAQAEKIVIGNVVSVESTVMDDMFSYTDPDTGQMVSRVEAKPYYLVTIQVERYIVDKAEEYSNVLTVRDPHVKGVFFVDGQKMDVISEYSSEYKIGERAAFFIYRSDDGSALETSGVTSKFSINENDATVQSLQQEKVGNQPRKLVDFEKEINEALSKSAQ